MSDLKCRATKITSCLLISTLVVLHIADSHPNSPDLERSICASLWDLAIPWTTSFHWTVRSYAQNLILKLHDLCQNKEHLISIIPNLPHLLTYLGHHPESQKHLSKMKLIPLASEGFHPLKNVHVEFIFRNMLAIGNVTESERISPIAFVKLDTCTSSYMPLRGHDIVDYSIKLAYPTL